MLAQPGPPLPPAPWQQPAVPVQPEYPVQAAPGQPGYGNPGIPAQYGDYNAAGAPAAYPYQMPGGPPNFESAPVRPRRRPPTWLLVGIPVVVVAVVASVLIAMNIGNAPNPAVNKVTCDTHTLTSCLIQPPAAAGKNSSVWASATSVDSNAYAAAYADAAALQQPTQVSSMLTGDGLAAIAHRSWYLGPNQIDLILLQFNSAQGAQAWAQDRTGDFLALGSGPQLTVPGNPGAKAYSTAGPDGSGDVLVRYITTVGSTDLEVHYASQGTLQQQDFQLWAGTQYASLQTSPVPTPSPSPTATTFQAATCPGSLTSCLMPFPPGGSQVPGLPSTYSIASYTDAFITKADAQTVAQKMKSDNVVAIDAESWGTNDFADFGQVVLVQTRTDAQAQELNGFIGGDADFKSSFTIPGYSSASGHYATTADANGFFGGLVDAQVGTIYLSLWLNFQNSFDVATAQSWAVQELNLLTQDTQSHWGFPIPQVTTPSLPAFQPGTCSATVLTGCLMALPSGATSTGTAAGAPPARSLSVNDFVGAIDPDRQNYQQAWLNADGAKEAATESWTVSNGASANDYIVRFGSARQAQAAVLEEAGDSLSGTQSCSVPSLPNLYCEVLAQNDSTGAVPIRIVGWSGPIELDLEVTKTDAADTGDALTWAQAQLQLLAGG
jgi:hypothetical protein